MKKFLLGLGAALLCLLALPSLATVTVIQKQVAVYSSAPSGAGLTPFDYCNDGTNTFSCLTDGTNIVGIDPTSKGLDVDIVACVSGVCNTNVTNAGTITAAAASASPVTSFGYVYVGGTWYQMLGDTSGRVVVVGAGTAGTAVGGVMTVQGVSGMTPFLENPGTAANWGIGAIGSAPPANAGYSGAVTGGATGGLLVGVIQANASAPISISTATTTQLVALSSGRSIYVTAWDVVAAGAGNITLEYGTGTACATGTTTLTGAYNLAANGGLTKGGGLGPVLVVPSGNALCALTSAAVQYSGSVAYAQF